ncbi:gfo/Idh/MocA family oxidoreductase, partial [Candidatus Sumerlaeota bacterium]|nr:gfo/Idh/MocA family oxidoreductase [Candidatus Sumerlaeota bacterium]
GDLLAARCYWCGGPVFRERVHKPEWGDLEWQIRAWYSYCWIGGDNIVEQHVHNLDVINWALGAHPVRAFGSGGRAWKSKEFEYMGNIWDNFSIDYEYEIGGRTVHLMSMSRHWERSDGMNGQFVVGTKRESNCSDNLGQPLERDAEPSMVREHMNLIASITGKGPHFNEAMQVAESSFTAILGRESAYSGRRLSWDDLLQSGLDLMPKPLSFDAKLPTPTIPAPGTYQIPGLAQKGPQKGSQKERKQRKAKA